MKCEAVIWEADIYWYLKWISLKSGQSTVATGVSATVNPCLTGYHVQLPVHTFTCLHSCGKNDANTSLIGSVLPYDAGACSNKVQSTCLWNYNCTITHFQGDCMVCDWKFMKTWFVGFHTIFRRIACALQIDHVLHRLDASAIQRALK